MPFARSIIQMKDLKDLLYVSNWMKTGKIYLKGNSIFLKIYFTGYYKIFGEIWF